MIIRVEHKARYTVIADASLKDERLSFRATGVLAYLLSLPDGADISGRRLCLAKKEGRDAVMSALKELEEAGYLRRDRTQEADGTWSTLCTLVESPSPENPDPVTENPPGEASDFQSPSPEKPAVGFPGPNCLVPEMNTKNSGGTLENGPSADDVEELLNAPDEDGQGPALQTIVRRLAAKSRA